MEVVVKRHPSLYCEGWSVVGNGSGMGGSYRDGCRIMVQGEGCLSTWAERVMGQCQTLDDVEGVDVVWRSY